MNKELIVMLTWHDVTVDNALEIFIEAKDAPSKHWGFKIEGTTPQSMKELVKCMKKNDKTVYIEVLAIDEETCVSAAKQCAECGVDHLLGTVYYDSVAKIVGEAGILYSPFVGLSDDSRLRGSIESVVGTAKDAEEKGVSGVSLSAFRYVDGDPKELLLNINKNLKKPLYIAGSVDGYEKIDFLKGLEKLSGFTIGGALFEKKFGSTFSEQITVISDYLKN
ncbi:MAG: hypothetical protein ACK5LL_01940 [Suipraeoptans sp.]